MYVKVVDIGYDSWADAMPLLEYRFNFDFKERKTGIWRHAAEW